MNSYYAWNNNDSVLLQSSSGGIFSALAEYVFRRGGVVYGAYMDPGSRRVFHRAAESAEALSGLRGSKYQQSDIGGVYRDIAEKLKAGTEVLFSGTPCQVAALRRYLGVRKVSSERLLCAEVLCHGVTSGKVVRAYTEEREKKRKSRIRGMSFRTKDRPWYQGSAMKLVYENGTSEIRDSLTDPFYIAYINSLILRPSCYACPFTRKEGREADLTIGDYWGAENRIRDRERLRKGIGLVLTNTEKGERVWQELTAGQAVTAEPLAFEDAVKKNGALVRPAKKNQRRSLFFDAMARNGSFSGTVYSLYRKKCLKNRIRHMIGYDNMRRLKAFKRRLKSR